MEPELALVLVVYSVQEVLLVEAELSQLRSDLHLRQLKEHRLVLEVSVDRRHIVFKEWSWLKRLQQLDDDWVVYSTLGAGVLGHKL